MKRLNFVLCLVCTLSISSAAHADSAVGMGLYPGDGSTSSPTWVPVSGMDSGVTAVAAGGFFHSLAVQNGAVYAWGGNEFGQLGDGTMTDRLTPVPVSGLASGVTAVAAGGSSNFARSFAVQNGAVFAWGSNSGGTLGDGTTTTRLTPVAVSGMDSGVTAVAAGNRHSLAVKNGGPWAWGANDNGQLGNGTISTFPTFFIPTPVAVIGMDSGVTAIAAGQRHSLAVKNGGVYSWGGNGYGQLGHGSVGGASRPTPELVAGLETGATAVAAGDQSSLAVVNGSAYAWNDYTGGTPVQVDPTNLSNIVAVAAADCCSAYALSSDGSLWFWNSQNMLPLLYPPAHWLPPTGYKFTSISAANTRVVATLAAIPEPNTLLLLCFGSLAVLWRRRPAARDLRP